MAINKAMQTALRALSYPDVKLKKTYKLVRGLGKITHPYYLKPFYRTWDHELVLDSHKIPVRIFSDSGKDPKKGENNEKSPVLLFFHGGGWVTGDISTYNNVCSTMAGMTGCRVVSVDYRLAPEHKFPAGLEDCYFAAKEIILHAEEHFGIDPSDVVLIGDSAGGNFCAAVSLLAKERGEFMPAKQILLYPAVNNDFSEHSQFSSIRENGKDYILTIKRLCDYMDLYQSSPADRMNPYFAPYLAKDLSGQPDTLVITAEYDPLRDEGEAYAKRLLEAGNHVELHRIQDALHGFFSLPVKFEPVEICYGYLNEFLGRHNGKQAEGAAEYEEEKKHTLDKA